MEPFPHDTNHNPKVLKTWDKRTRLRSNMSGEDVSNSSDVDMCSIDEGSSGVLP